MEMTDVQFVARLLAIPLALVIDPIAPILVFGIALRMGWITDPVLTGPAFAGFADPVFIAVVGVLYVVHTLADKVPLFAHLFDGIGLVAKPLAGAVVGFWMTNQLDPNSTLHWVSMAVVLFGGIPAAASLQLARAKVRLATSAGSGGLLHPVVSTAESVVAVPIAAAAVVRPELALLMIALIVLPALWLGLRLIRAALGIARQAAGGVKGAITKSASRGGARSASDGFFP